MPDYVADFEPANSWCYKFSRYQALPEILAMPEVVGGQSFRLIELSRRVLDNHLTTEQQGARFKRARTEGEVSIAASVKFYIPFLAKGTGLLTNEGEGMFRLPSADDIETEVVEAALEAGDEEAGEFDGWIYAFSFPLLIKSNGPYPIKVGKTTVEVQERVTSQCKGSAGFDKPKVLGQWRFKRVGAVELAVHNILKARGRWRENVPGTEWFDTTIVDIGKIIAFIGGSPE
ncbi:MAG: GIY-YIG nuclease family protein [Burkholderiaceae bacterium]|nr:GIY-YIG nuclease family protein [Burkholderiaceae bacterium]